MMLLISSSDLISMFLSIELQSLPLYILATIYKDSESATSASLKYFLLGAISSTFILLGSALLYTFSGETTLAESYCFSLLFSMGQSNTSIQLGILIITIGLLFKVAAVPFHNWSMDVYDGVPTVVTSWIAIIPKISIFIFLAQFMIDLSSYLFSGLLLVSSFLSLFIGTVGTLVQTRIKRLLGYSGITHSAFLLLSLGINTEDSIQALFFYLIQYSLSSLTIFASLMAIGLNSLQNPRWHKHNKGIIYSPIQNITQLRGLFYAHPLLGLGLAIALFSLAGIPPFIGFFAKLQVFYAAIKHGYYFLTIVAVLSSVISAGYYLNLIKIIFFEHPNPSSFPSGYSSIPSPLAFLIAVLTLFIIAFIFLPGPLLNGTQLMALTFLAY